eukprot:gene16765-biopygen11021
MFGPPGAGLLPVATAARRELRGRARSFDAALIRARYGARRPVPRRRRSRGAPTRRLAAAARPHPSVTTPRCRPIALRSFPPLRLLVASGGAVVLLQAGDHVM